MEWLICFAVEVPNHDVINQYLSHDSRSVPFLVIANDPVTFDTLLMKSWGRILIYQV